MPPVAQCWVLRPCRFPPLSVKLGSIVWKSRKTWPSISENMKEREMYLQFSRIGETNSECAIAFCICIDEFFFTECLQIWVSFSIRTFFHIHEVLHFFLLPSSWILRPFKLVASVSCEIRNFTFCEWREDVLAPTNQLLFGTHLIPNWKLNNGISHSNVTNRPNHDLYPIAIELFWCRQSVNELTNKWGVKGLNSAWFEIKIP